MKDELGGELEANSRGPGHSKQESDMSRVRWELDVEGEGKRAEFCRMAWKLAEASQRHW